MKYTVEQFIVKYASCPIEECSLQMTAEGAALDVLVDDFARAMKNKLRLKFMEGQTGWDNPMWTTQEIYDALMEHLKLPPRGYPDMVDVANFAAFLWNRQNGDTI